MGVHGKSLAFIQKSNAFFISQMAGGLAKTVANARAASAIQKKLPLPKALGPQENDPVLPVSTAVTAS